MHESMQYLPTIGTNAEVVPHLGLASRQLCTVRSGTNAEQAAIRFIQSRFLESYGARPKLQVPRLMTLMNRDCKLLAAVGLRDAASESLFLEDYLDQPIEDVIPDSAKVTRHQIVEVAHLAGLEPGVSRYLFPLLTVWLTVHEVQWIAFTGTAHLRNSFDRLGIRTQIIDRADPSRLPDKGRAWGRYYDQGPMVMVAHVPSGYTALTKLGVLRHIHSVPSAGGHYELTA